ncbi:hypothetical protein Gasu2_60850 [Galdieria sulphuraria]|uniref:Uncharacterized protein n=1 Tax=Galdieria sulphuraria TaxID=130081 RepID=M2W2K5_GALSU|nr:uncharacterized protein Gasu_27070 [Galdieria sulphuraria]EME29921.1 hypothetical protein Gasu_27070 [Galdieria sulphuraria]GJD11970.1 hypothetical protein Gasu2_60850 [Galdieria sulphuraria]|eukprot:XP_005706441.1 hypothetical protein Gasu_27070 [Galdieria sulphuraria]
MLNHISEASTMKSLSLRGTKTYTKLQPNSLRSENLDWSSPASKKDEDLSDLLWKIKLASIHNEDSDEPLEEDSRVARTQSVFPYLLDYDSRNGCISRPTKQPISLFALGNTSDSSVQSDSSIHWMASSDPVNEEGIALFPDSCSSRTVFSNVSPTRRISESLSPVSPTEKFSKSSSKKTNVAPRQETSDGGIGRIRNDVGPKVVMLVLLAHLEHVYKYACLVRDLLQLYSIDVSCKMEEEDGSSILPEHVAPIASKIPETTRIMLIGPRHVLDGTCHFQTWNGRCIESTLFVAIDHLLEENLRLQCYPKMNVVSTVGVVSPYCSSVSVFVNKVTQILNTRHSLHSQLLMSISVCEKCSLLFKSFLEKRLYSVDSCPMETLISALDSILPRRQPCFYNCRAAYHSNASSVTRKTLYLFSIMRHWELCIHSVRERCAQLYRQLSQMATFHNDLEREMRLFLLKQIVDKWNVLDKSYQEMKQLWNALVTKWL